jgi:F-type H+-transporting ATPase subunit delta
MEIHANPISRVYAEALFRTAQSRGVVEDTLESLHGLVAMMQTHPEFHLFLTAPMIDVERKKAAVVRALQGNVDELLIDFLCLLIDKDREEALEGILQQFRMLADEEAGRVRVQATTSHALTEPQRSALLESLQNNLRRQCTLEANVEPELIGGLVLRIGDKLYDGSVRRQLQRVGDQLMRSSGYEN